MEEKKSRYGFLVVGILVLILFAGSLVLLVDRKRTEPVVNMSLPESEFISSNVSGLVPSNTGLKFGQELLEIDGNKIQVVVEIHRSLDEISRKKSAQVDMNNTINVGAEKLCVSM